MRTTRAPRRRPSAATALSIAALVIALSGTAYAATGGTFILGRTNHESSTATLADSKGTALALTAPAHTAPLAVNRTAMVKNLNAQYLGGLSETGLAETGGEGFSAPGTHTALTATGAIVAATGHLPAGIYYVSASANVFLAQYTGYGACWIADGSAPDTMINEGLTTSPSDDVTVSETAAVQVVTAGDELEELCQTQGPPNGSTANDAGIIAIRILSTSVPETVRPRRDPPAGPRT